MNTSSPLKLDVYCIIYVCIYNDPFQTVLLIFNRFIREKGIRNQSINSASTIYLQTYSNHFHIYDDHKFHRMNGQFYHFRTNDQPSLPLQ